jgi:DNA-binding IclR family transcriptional regulator
LTNVRSSTERSTATQAVVKTFALIDALVELGEATAVELSRLTGEPRSSVYRILTTLQQLELVEPGSRRGLFRAGVGLLRLGGSALARFDERQLAMPTLERLRAETRETVHLAVRRSKQAVFIEQLPGERAFMLRIGLGGVLPLHVGASPRLLLALEPYSFWDEYFEAVVVEQWTPRALGSEAEVRERLEEIRETGVSLSDEDVVLGIATVAAPIVDHRGKPRAALAFNLLPEVLRRDPERYIAIAREAGEEASRAFGYDPRFASAGVSA